jgi:predicted alpha-1,2-mannosidase
MPVPDEIRTIAALTPNRTPMYAIPFRRTVRNWCRIGPRTRQLRSGGIALTAAAAALLLSAAPAVADLSSLVDPFVGTSGGGNTFPGPVMPGGMIALGPETVSSSGYPAGSAQPSGYDYNRSQLRGFTLDRMSGAGCAEFGDVPMMPATQPITASPVSDASSPNLDSSYFLSFSHHDETASPGYYSVSAQPGSGAGPIQTELTTAIRSAIARFTFPAGAGASSILLNAGGSAAGDQAASVRIDPRRRLVTGSSTGGGFCASPDHYTVYFAARFDQPFDAYGTWTRRILNPGSTAASDVGANQPVAGYLVGSQPRAQAGAYVSFDTQASRTVGVKVGISFVSAAGAERNLDAEVGSLDFDQIRAAAQQAWNAALGVAQVTGGDAEVRRFYTALYQALIEPNTFSDVDGRYPGMDGRIHVARGYTQYANLSGWDIYRTQIPLLAMLRPAEAASIARSFLADADQSGWLPKWSVANFQTAVMNGDSADPILADAYAFGARGFDAGRALAQMIHGATQSARSNNDCYVERQQLGWYEKLGYIPHEYDGGIVAVGEANGTCELGAQAGADGGATALLYGEAAATLEYVSDDFAISRLAAALGKPTACRKFLRRSGSWRTLWNSADGYLEPRYSTGSWVPNYDPNSNDSFSMTSGFTEGDAAQYTWMVPFDYAGLTSLMGGTSPVQHRLDNFFTQLNSGTTGPYSYLGNEPTLETPWIYDWLGAPSRTQRIVRQALLRLFTNAPDGLPGNDDLGTMSAWYVLAALGMYPEIPGSDVLALGSPLFPQITVQLPHGVLTILAAQAADDAPYVQSLTLNGSTHDRPWLRFSDLAQGGTLDFGLSSAPSATWGTGPDASPPSFAPADQSSCNQAS